MKQARAVRLLRAGAVVAGAVPESVVSVLSGAAGAVWFAASAAGAPSGAVRSRLRGPARQRFLLSRHLRRARPAATPREIDRLVRRGFASYVRYWVDLLRLPRMPARQLNRKVRIEGLEHFDLALAEGRGMVVAMPHLGGWEFGGAWLARNRHVHIVAVAERLANVELFEWFVAQRESVGIHVVALGPDAGVATARALKEGAVVALPCDRDLSGTGVEVSFLGERTTLPAGPVTLALRSGAPLLTAAVFDRSRGRRVVRVRAPWTMDRSGDGLRADVARHTQRLADELGELIRAQPDQWHLLQANWPSDRLAVEEWSAGSDHVSASS